MRIKEILQGDYNYDSTVRSGGFRPGRCRTDPPNQPSFYALYRSFTECLFVEEDGNIVFYKNGEGKAARAVDPAYFKRVE